MSAARHAAKPRAKFMARIMALVSVAGSCWVPPGRVAVPFANLRAKLRGIEALAQGGWAIALGSRGRRIHARDSLRLAPFPGRSINQACRDFRPLSSFLTMPL